MNCSTDILPEFQRTERTIAGLCLLLKCAPDQIHERLASLSTSINRKEAEVADILAGRHGISVRQYPWKDL